jgi:hypothetical protein
MPISIFTGLNYPHSLLSGKQLTGIQIAGHICPAPQIPFLCLAISQPINTSVLEETLFYAKSMGTICSVVVNKHNIDRGCRSSSPMCPPERNHNTVTNRNSSRIPVGY